MELLTDLGTAPGRGNHLVVMFGLGMIGSAIRSRLLRLGFSRFSSIPFDWMNDSSRRTALTRLDDLVRRELTKPGRVSFCWAAGHSNFHSTPESIARESRPFDELLALVESLKPNSGGKLRFHYISSAGGLFEGQQMIDRSSLPEPIRPYGKMKLKQECQLEAIFAEDAVAVYRPSSVYGPMRQKKQQGLINNLVKNAQNRKVSTLDAHMMALRDYVFSGDLGEFIARGILSGIHGTFFMVSGRSTSIHEVVKKVEHVLKMRMNVKYDESFGNHTNITFRPDVLPAGWRPMPLEVGIRQFMFSQLASRR